MIIQLGQKAMRKNKNRLKIFALVFFVFIFCSFSAQSADPVLKKQGANHLEIHVIDVGQGDSFLIVSPSGKKILIDGGDTGKGSKIILPYLSNHGISSIDYVIASHFHADHIGGLDEVINGLGGSGKIAVAAYDRGGTYNSKAFQEYIASMGDKRKTILPDQIIDLGDGVTLKCIASSGYTPGGRVYYGDDENALSVVVLLKYRTFDAYFGGDSNLYIEPYLVSYAGDVDIYKVSHHGSSTSSTQVLLNTLKPEVSVISVGDGNPYGHPHYETISRLVSINSYIYQTETGSAPPPQGKGEVANGSFLITTDGYFYTISGSALITRIRPTDSARPEVYYWLRIYATTGGTTIPSPGEYKYKEGSIVNITAVPYTHYYFSSWTGDVSSTENPITITMNKDISITANFLRIIYPPLNARGEKIFNRSLLLAEYINVLSWEANPNNENITHYKIYLIEGMERALLATLSSGDFKYFHRRVDKAKTYTYWIRAVDNSGREGDPAIVTIR
jgi:beta-lactamase superfamily II metal-dependent hydrolase